MKVKLTNVRAAFVSVFEPKAVNGEGTPRYSITGIFERGSEQEKTLREAIKAVAKEKWKSKADEVLSGLEKKDRICLHDGDDKANYDGFPGNLFVSASSTTRPKVVDRDKTKLSPEDGRPYSGCYVTLILDIWAMDNQFGRRVNASLLGVQFYDDGIAFGGGAPASDDDFDDLDGDGFDDLVAA